MALKANLKCHVCKLIVDNDKRLLERINHSKQFVAGGESLVSIHADYSNQFSYKSLFTHVHKHQAPNKKTLRKKVAAIESKQALAEITTAETKRKVNIFRRDGFRDGYAELGPIGAYEGNQTATRGQLIDKLLSMAMEGQIKWSGGNLVSLLAQEQKAEEAAKDREFELMKMVNHWIAQKGVPSDYLEHTNDTYEEGEVVEGGGRGSGDASGTSS